MFNNHLRHAARRKVMRQAGDDPFLKIFPRPAAVAKAERLERRGHKRGIRRNQVERPAAYGFEKITHHNFQIGCVRGLGVEARATGRSRIDINGEHLTGVDGSEQRMNARASAKVEGGAKRSAYGTARQTAAIGTDRHDVIAGNGGVSRMRKFGPSVVGKDQAVADGKQRRTRPGKARLIDYEQPDLDQNIAFRQSEQSVEFIR